MRLAKLAYFVIFPLLVDLMLIAGWYSEYREVEYWKQWQTTTAQYYFECEQHLRQASALLTGPTQEHP